jgi:hypothetical protein
MQPSCHCKFFWPSSHLRKDISSSLFCSEISIVLCHFHWRSATDIK